MTEMELRPWREEDICALPALAGDWEVAKNLRDVFPHPYGETDAMDYIRSVQAAPPQEALMYAIAVDGRLAGSIGIFREKDVYRKSAELGYWLGRDYWGRGIMTWSVGEICAEALAKWDIVRIFAEPFARNLGSRRVLEKNGFRLEGIKKKSVYKAGEILDSCMYALVIGEDEER